jgi:hypothetical protein
VPGVPQLEGIVVTPLSVALSLQLAHGPLFETLSLIGNQGVVVLRAGQESDDLARLVLDDDRLRRFVLLFV